MNEESTFKLVISDKYLTFKVLVKYYVFVSLMGNNTFTFTAPQDVSLFKYMENIMKNLTGLL